ncbi:acyl-CoA dehydrogenase family protein [Nocardioides sp. NPDC057767]|uniref:acyl-CoA dehydrogenase family protein n=1 Tax=unclassified Nocardioides TaxID=2615069 RepID=UPI00366BE110
MPSLLYGEVEEDLRSAVRDLLADRTPIDSVLTRSDQAEAFDAAAREVWSSLVDELGIAALAVPEEFGGAGATWLEVATVLEELGRGVIDVPFFTSAVLATALAQEVGAVELVGELASGAAVGAVVWPFASPLAPVPELTWDGQVLSGSVKTVAGALEATHLLVPTSDGLVLVEAARAQITPTPSLDMTRRVADIVFDHVEGQMIVARAELDRGLERAAQLGGALLASEQLGIAERMLEMTVDYLKQRRQFGRTLGSYQALKHRLADLWTAIAQARAVARYAAACAGSSDEGVAADLPVASAMAQAVCSEVALLAAEESVQMHGGIGFTWEHPAHLYLKRARADALAMGSPAWYRGELAGLVGIGRS